ncbi:hypothetical protein P0Y35_10765 [Kiritimatiellaeota bacterium B1221]|nr:hypothetical protein [Kiritimatiellaeota bacterium B1221]
MQPYRHFSNIKLRTRIAATAFFFLSSASNAQILWDGLNSNSGSSATDINDGANWIGGSIPGAGDTALIQFYDNSDGAVEGDLYIADTDINFNPEGFEYNANFGLWYGIQSDLYIDKSLTLPLGMVFTGTGSGGGGSVRENRLRIGTQTTGVVINTSSWDISQSTGRGSPSWGFFNLGGGDANPASGTIINITGSTVNFNTPTTDGDGSLMQVTGGSREENATNDLNPQFRFTGVGATINVEQAGNRTAGAMGLGLVHLDVRSDQTWNFDDLAFVTMTASAGESGPGRYVVESIDGGRLDNLGGLNIRMNGMQSVSHTDQTAMRMHGGTYGSLWMNSEGSSGRTHQINQTGHVSFMNDAVVFNGGIAEGSGYSMILRNSDGNSDAQIYDTKGYDLTLEQGLKLVDDASETNSGYNFDPILLIVEDSDVIIKGDVRMEAPNGKGPDAPASGNLAHQNMGIDGGANGTHLTLGGNWDVRINSYSGRDNLRNSTLVMNGGTPGGSAVTFEVADAAAATGDGGITQGSWGMDHLKIGNGAADTAHVQLVNNHLNNNPVSSGGLIASDLDGEKLIVGTLEIDEDSVLDANLNSASVEIGAGSLLLASGAVLDLNSGQILNLNDTIDNFVGLGDQTSTWSLFADQISDSSNPLAEFGATTDGSGNTVWQVTAIPEPGTFGLILLTGVGLIYFQFRRK